MRRVLAISGKRFSGKDTLAAMIADAGRERGEPFATYAFAGASKRMFVSRQRERGVNVELERLSSDRAYKEHWRPALTELTEAAIAADPLVFVRDVARAIDADPRHAVITDLRLQLELDWLVSRFELVTARILRPDARRAESGWIHTPSKDDHVTETDLDDHEGWAHVVVNDGSLADLHVRADELVSAFLR